MIVRIRPLLDIEKTVEVLNSTKESDTHLIGKFEKKFAAYIGSPKAFAFHQGRSALLIALKILEIKPGDDVIVQSYIFHVVIDAILEVGANPVLVDSSLEDFNISPQAIKEEITPRTKAIVATHLGLPCKIDEISNIAKENNCFLIENCAHALGAQYNGENTGTFGDLSFFSFDVDKPFSTGDGGMLVINNLKLLDKAREIFSQYKRISFEKEKEILYGLLLQHFVTDEEIYPENGFIPVDFGKNLVKKDQELLFLLGNAIQYRNDKGFQEHILPYLMKRRLLENLHKNSLLHSFFLKIYTRAKVAMGLVKIKRIDSDRLLMNTLRSAVGIACLEDFNKAKDIRNRNTQCYINFLNKNIYIHPQIGEKKKPAFIRYIVLNNTKTEKEDITFSARKHGFELGIFNWSVPVHLCYPYNKILSFDREKLKNSEYLGRNLLSLPIHPYVNESSVKRIAKFLNEFGSRPG